MSDTMRQAAVGRAERVSRAVREAKRAERADRFAERRELRRPTSVTLRLAEVEG